MKIQYLLNEGLKFLEMVLGVKYGAQGFFILLGVGVVGLVIIPYLLGRWIGSTNRGAIGCSLGVLIPIVVGFIGYEVWGAYGGQWFGEAEWVTQCHTLMGLVSGGLALLIISPFMFGIGFIKTIVVFFVSVLALMGALSIGQKVVLKDKGRAEGRIWYDPRTWKGK